MSAIVMGGKGQVGSALVEILEQRGIDVQILDQDGDFKPRLSNKYKFLHVTIPHSDYFNKAVRRAVKKYQPEYVIIHSTVPVGTTRRIGWYAAHSPVRGNHPNLKGALLKFVKYVGAHNDKTRVAVVTHLRDIGMTVEDWSKPEETELMKELCLSRYLNDLAFYETAFKACRKFGVAPIRLVQWTNSYNDGYAGTRYPRPELTFPMGHVGGHCVMPVAKMLSQQTGYKFFRKNLDVFDGKG